MMHMTKCISILTHPRTLGFPWIRIARGGCHVALACVGPTSSMCLHDQFPLLFSIVFIYLYPLLNIYSILIFKHHLLSPLFQISKLQPQT